MSIRRDFYNTGGHLNPAVTIAFCGGWYLPWEQVVGYIIAQILGAFVGAAIVVFFYYPHFKETKAEEGNSVGVFATGPAIRIQHLICSANRCDFLLHLCTFDDNARRNHAWTPPLLVGFLIMAVGLSLGSTTGFALNPAGTSVRALLMPSYQFE